MLLSMSSTRCLSVSRSDSSGSAALYTLSSGSTDIRSTSTSPLPVRYKMRQKSVDNPIFFRGLPSGYQSACRDGLQMLGICLYILYLN